MRIAAIYDIHGNLPALEAVLQDINNYEVDLIVVGGDVVAGPLPNETLTLLQNTNISTHFILGNAESDVLRHLAGEEINGLSERANEEARWVSENLTTEHKHFISSWTPTLTLHTDEWGEVLFCHGTPRSDMEVFTKITPEEVLEPVFEDINSPLIICGHTHIQFNRMVGKVRVVNAGSVGMPFGVTGADWLLLGNDIKLRHSNFDLDKAADHIRKSNYPYAEEFVTSNVMQAPDEEKMLKILTQMEIKNA